MLSDNDRETLATGITFITGVSVAVLGIISTLHYGWSRTLMLCGMTVLFFTLGAIMAHFVVKPLRRRATAPAPAPAPTPTPLPIPANPAPNINPAI